MVFGSGFPSGFPVPTVFNPIYGLWVRFPLRFSCPNCVESHIWSLGSVSIPYMVFGSGFPSGFPVPTVLNPIYGLWIRFPLRFSCPNCVESHIWSLGSVSIPYMVFGSGFPSGFPVPTVLNPIYGLWVRFQSHIWSLGLVSPRVFLSQLC